MNEILSIRLVALRLARVFPNVKIFFDSAEGVLGKITIPRRLLLIKHGNKICLVFTKRRYESVADLIGCDYLGGENLLLESYQAGESTPHDFREIFQLLVEDMPEEHYLKILAARCDRVDGNNSEDPTSYVEIFGPDLVSLVNRGCSHYIGRHFENSINLLADDDGDVFGGGLLDMISDVCLLASSVDGNLKNRLLTDVVKVYGEDLVDFVCERSREIYRSVQFRFDPNLLLRSLLSDERPSPMKFNYYSPIGG